MSGMGSTLQLNNPTVVAALGWPDVHLVPVVRRFRVQPVPGHQRDHSLRLVRVSWVL